jgi:sugar phosphate permease
MDAQQEAVLKKIAWRVVPLLTLAYVVNYLDRTNISVAALTMNKDLGLSASQSAWARESCSSATPCLRYRRISPFTASARGAGSPAS